MRCVLLLALLLALPSCGKFSRLPEGKTSVSFQVEGRSPTALLPGIMVYAVRADNVLSKGARFVPSEATSLNWLIPNGNYHFFAFGYQSADMQGTMYCGSVLNKPLSGGSVTVSLVLDDQGQCGLPPFSPGGYGSADTHQTRPLYLGGCDNATGDISLTDAFSGSCNGSGGRPTAGNYFSYQMKFSEFERWNPAEPPQTSGNGLSTGCVSGAFTGGAVTANRSPPYGEAFVAELSIYSNSSCTIPAGNFTMTQGIVNSGNNATVRFRNASDTLVNPALQMMKPNSGSSSVYFFLRLY
jgi:hypothetical protein